MSSSSPIPAGKGVPDFASSTPPSSVWDRISTWASENKAVVYTIAGVAIVVTGAGVAYYLTDTVRWNNASSDRETIQLTE
jgi:mitochondrial import receptor subunit TOM70